MSKIHVGYSQAVFISCVTISGMVFRADTRAIWFNVNTESVAWPLFFSLGTYVVGVPFLYVDYISESCWTKTKGLSS